MTVAAAGTPVPAPPDAAELLLACHELGLDGAAGAHDLASAATWLALHGGDRLLERGDHADAMYLLAAGRLRVGSPRGFGGPVDLHPVTVVGEAGLLGDTTRSSDVWATRDTLVARIDRADFELLCERAPRVALRLARVVAQRAAGANIGSIVGADVPANVVIVIARSPRLGDGAEVARRFQALPSLRAHVEVVTADRPDAEHLVRQADLVLLFAAADDAPTIAPLQAHWPVLASPRTAGRLELVLVHPHGAPIPRGTARWLALGPFAAHHHLRSGSDADLRRLARSVQREAVGVVLGGGGARGLAHIGVLAALHDAGIPVDLIGGTSMGALVAAIYAQGWSPLELQQWSREHVDQRITRDLDVPTVAALRGRRLRALVAMAAGDRTFEDLWLPCFCTTVNLTAGALAVHRTGPVATYAVGSASVPGVFPPVVDGSGEVHIDGGLGNNLPADVMRSLGAAHVIGVDVGGQPPPLRLDPSSADHLGLARVIAKRRGRPVLPSIGETMNRALLMTRNRQRAAVEPDIDVLIAPDLDGFSFTSFERVDGLVEAGRRAAERVLAAGGDAIDVLATRATR